MNRLQKILLVLIFVLSLPVAYCLVAYKKYNKTTFLSVNRTCIPGIIKPYLSEVEIVKIEGKTNLQEKVFGRKCNYNMQ